MTTRLRMIENRLEKLNFNACKNLENPTFFKKLENYIVIKRKENRLKVLNKFRNLEYKDEIVDIDYIKNASMEHEMLQDEHIKEQEILKKAIEYQNENYELINQIKYN